MIKYTKKTIEKNGDKMWFIIGTIAVAIMLIGTILSLIAFSVRVNKAFEILNGQDVREKDSYYVMITGDDESVFWEDVYTKARALCEQDNIELEILSTHLEGNYSAAELVGLAAISGVDGIIIKADESEAMYDAINEASANGIPVVTVMEDSAVSSRKSFVQVGSYNIGREYGRQVLKNLKEGEYSILVVMEAGTRDSSQNLIMSGLQETIEAGSGIDKSVKFDVVAIDSQDSFAAEESIRKMLIPGSQTPDVMITLNELTTTCAYQAMIDFNRVGTVTLLGLGESDTIRKGISQGVIDATIAVNTDEMGTYCIEALNEYRQTGYVSEYYSVDTKLITKEIIDKEKSEEEQQKSQKETIVNGGVTDETP